MDGLSYGASQVFLFSFSLNRDRSNNRENFRGNI